MNFPDAKDQPVNADERVKKNIGEGRGLKFTTSLGGKAQEILCSPHLTLFGELP